jgi:transposase
MTMEITMNLVGGDFIPGRLLLTKEEIDNLREFARDEVGREATRALIILWFNERKTETEIADLLFISNRSVRRCLRRYKEKKIDGLYDKEKPGRPRKADKTVEKAIEDTLEKNPEDFGYCNGYWITSGLMKMSNIQVYFPFLICRFLFLLLTFQLFDIPSAHKQGQMI